MDQIKLIATLRPVYAVTRLSSFFQSGERWRPALLHRTILLHCSRKWRRIASLAGSLLEPGAARVNLNL
jgi:hypothetical protein